MTRTFMRRLAMVSCLFLSIACGKPGTQSGGGGNGGAGGGGSGGSSGTGGAGGTPAAPTAGLWTGSSAGIAVCFYIDERGNRLVSNIDCDIPGASPAVGNSYDLEVSTIGRDQNGEPCSFSLSYALDVVIDRETRAFGAEFVEEGTGAQLAFSGELVGLDASGLATRVDDESTCTVGWAASRSAPCDEAALNACFELQECCQAILVNPVFFETCIQVVRECNEVQCRQLLAGYEQCRDLDL